MKIALVVLSLMSPVHDVWADGSPVPRWVKSACCGPVDVHNIDISDLIRVQGGWMIRGLDSVVPDNRVYPSQDGQVWAFWPPIGKLAPVHCLFIPWSM